MTVEEIKHILDIKCRTCIHAKESHGYYCTNFKGNPAKAIKECKAKAFEELKEE